MWIGYHWRLMFIIDICFPACCRQTMCNIYYFDHRYHRTVAREHTLNIRIGRSNRFVWVGEGAQQCTHKIRSSGMEPTINSGPRIIKQWHRGDINRRFHFKISTSDLVDWLLMCAMYNNALYFFLSLNKHLLLLLLRLLSMYFGNNTLLFVHLISAHLSHTHSRSLCWLALWCAFICAFIIFGESLFYLDSSFFFSRVWTASFFYSLSLSRFMFNNMPFVNFVDAINKRNETCTPFVINFAYH